MSRRSPVIAVADDLTGALETAAGLAALTSTPGSAEVEVLTDAARLRDAGAPVTVIDTDSRDLPREQAAARARVAIAAARRAAGAHGLVVKKIDSLLRGSTAAEIAALADDGPALLAPALPALGRVVSDGRMTFGGDRSHPLDLAGLAGGRAIERISLRVVRSRDDELTRTIGHAVRAGRLPVVDSETDDDLDAVARAVMALPELVAIGSGGLAAAIGRALPASPGTPHRIESTQRPLAVIVGSAEASIAAQLVRLARHGASIVDAEGEPGTAEVAVFVPPQAGEALDTGETAARVIDRALNWSADADLVVIGGRTARTLVGRLAEPRLRPLALVHPGAVVSSTASGRLIASRPGSFGDADSLVLMSDAVRALRTGAAVPCTPPEKGKKDT